MEYLVESATDHKIPELTAFALNRLTIFVFIAAFCSMSHAFAFFTTSLIAIMGKMVHRTHIRRQTFMKMGIDLRFFFQQSRVRINGSHNTKLFRV